MQIEVFELGPKHLIKNGKELEEILLQKRYAKGQQTHRIPKLLITREVQTKTTVRWQRITIAMITLIEAEEQILVRM